MCILIFGIVHSQFGVAPLPYLRYTFDVHLVYLCYTPHFFCCSSNKPLFCLSCTSCTSLAPLKFPSSSFVLPMRTSRRSQDALKRHTPVPLLFLLAREHYIIFWQNPKELFFQLLNSYPMVDFFSIIESLVHIKANFPFPTPS